MSTVAILTKQSFEDSDSLVSNEINTSDEKKMPQNSLRDDGLSDFVIDNFIGF